VNEGFLLVLEAAEASRLERGWPADHGLVALISADGSVLQVQKVRDDELDGVLTAFRHVRVHPARPGHRTVHLEFSREAAVLSAVGDALPECAPVEAPVVDVDAPPAANSQLGRIAVARAAAEAAGLSPGDALALEVDPDGTFAARRIEMPRPARIHWVWRDLAIATAMLGSFVLGLAGGR
jgi:hypothetical protein